VSEQPQRQILPIPDITPAGLTTFEATDPDTSYPPITPLRPPAGAPNVLVILLDDVGFGPRARSQQKVAAQSIHRCGITGHVVSEW
jgi:hypothetical protein